MEFELPESHKEFYFEFGHCMANWMRVEKAAFHMFFVMATDLGESIVTPISWYHIQSFDSKIELMRTLGKLQIKKGHTPEWADILARLKKASLTRNAIIHGAQEEAEDGDPYIRPHDLDIGAFLKGRQGNPKYVFDISALREKGELFGLLARDVQAFATSCFPHALENLTS